MAHVIKNVATLVSSDDFQMEGEQLKASVPAHITKLPISEINNPPNDANLTRLLK